MWELHTLGGGGGGELCTLGIITETTCHVENRSDPHLSLKKPIEPYMIAHMIVLGIVNTVVVCRAKHLLPAVHDNYKCTIHMHGNSHNPVMYMSYKFHPCCQHPCLHIKLHISNSLYSHFSFNSTQLAEHLQLQCYCSDKPTYWKWKCWLLCRPGQRSPIATHAVTYISYAYCHTAWPQDLWRWLPG